MSGVENRILHQEKHDLEIYLNFLLISKKQEIWGNCGNSREISGNSCRFLRRLKIVQLFSQFSNMKFIFA